jgi:glycosyltransferase involved in cell wall biosynthesis
MSKKKLLFLVNVDWFFISHRLPIAVAASKSGFEVHIAASMTGQENILREAGFIFHDIPISRGSAGPFSFFKTMLEIIKLFRAVNPDLVHLITIKPILLGGIAARIVGINGVIAAISGLGYVFINKGFIASTRRWAVKVLYKISLGHKNLMVICQNLTDLNYIQKTTSLPDRSFTVIDGSGVSLQKFQYTVDTNKIPKVMMASRVLKDKGVLEFVEAATIMQNSGIQAAFILVGSPDPGNPTSIPISQIQDWVKKGILEFWGYQEDMNQILGQASIIVLPSYREGFPKVLIEAAAIGRPVVTTDVAGCRDAIYNGITGVLVPPKDSNALAEEIKKLIDSPETCHKMGIEGRKMAEERFDEKITIERHLSIYDQILLGESNNGF